MTLRILLSVPHKAACRSRLFCFLLLVSVNVISKSWAGSVCGSAPYSLLRLNSDYLADTYVASRQAMHKKYRCSITMLLRNFAIREYSEELDNNLGPRFKAELIYTRKGSMTDFIAHQASNNIDGRLCQTKSALKQVNQCVIARRTWAPHGHYCTAFSSSAYS